MWSRCSFVVAVMCAMLSCSYPEKIASPNPVIPGQNPEDAALVSIARLKLLYGSSPVTIREDWKIRGEVISTDRFGNFNRKFALRDGSAAIEIKINRANLWKDYWLGDSIEVYCNGLTIGGYGGLPQLGAAPSGLMETTALESSDEARHVKWIGVASSPPRPVSFAHVSELSEKYLSDFVRLEKVQAIEDDVARNWCDSGLDTDRYFVDENLDTLIVRTYRYATIAITSNYIPPGSGWIEGVLSCFNGRFQLVCSDMLFCDLTQERF